MYIYIYVFIHTNTHCSLGLGLQLQIMVRNTEQESLRPETLISVRTETNSFHSYNWPAVIRYISLVLETSNPLSSNIHILLETMEIILGDHRNDGLFSHGLSPTLHVSESLFQRQRDKLLEKNR